MSVSFIIQSKLEAHVVQVVTVIAFNGGEVQHECMPGNFEDYEKGAGCFCSYGRIIFMLTIECSGRYTMFIDSWSFI